MTDTIAIPGYRIDRLLGQGGMAEVYLAEQLSLGRMIAIKVMDPHLCDREFTERFLHEARMVASMNHVNIITIYDFGKLPSEKLFLCMEYLEGGDLEHRLRNGVNETQAIRVMQELGSGLRFVHSKGVIHRDIKPANILFRQDDSLVLTDFGIAKEINNDVGLTQAGMMVGSASYASPEQIQGLQVDLRTDIYSIGILLLEMLTGNNPFKADTFINTAMNHLQMDIPTLNGAHARFQKILNKTIAKKPSDRFGNMEEFLAELEALEPVTGAKPVQTAANTYGHTDSHTIHVPKATPVETQKMAVPTQIKEHIITPLENDFKILDGDDNDEFMDEALKLLAETETLSHTPGKPDASTTNQKTSVMTPSGQSTGKSGKSALFDGLLNEEDIAKAMKLGNINLSTPTPAIRGGNTSAPARTRPLPSNLLDDEDI